MNLPLLNRLSRGQRRLVFWVLGLFLAYVIIGFLALPPIVRSIATKQLTKQLGRDVSIQQIKLNPLAFSGTIRGLLIKETNGEPFVSWDEAYGNFQPTSLFGHTWVFKELRTSQPFIHVQMNGDGTFNFSDILNKFSSGTNTAPKGPPKQFAIRVDQIGVAGATLSLKRDQPPAGSIVAQTDPAPTATVISTNSLGSTNKQEAIILLLQSVTNVFAVLSQTTNSLAASVGNLALSNCTVRLEDLANPRPARLTLDQIAVHATNLSNLPFTNSATAVSLRWNTNGTLNTEINASITPPSVDVHIAFANLELHPLDPYLDSRLSVFIIGSKLGMDGRIRLRAPEGALPEVTFNGDTWLKDFNSVDGVLGEELLKWNSVHISGIDANLNPPTVAVHEIGVDDFYARLIIETNRTINILAAMHMASTNETTNATPEAPAEQTTVMQKAKKLLANDTVISTNALAQLPIKKLTISSIVISNASADFTDRSISPNVNMAVQQINGTIDGISSEELQHADVSLHAKVDNVGPVDITGHINPFSKDQTNEINIAVTNVDLTPASPYSGKFAGYRIAKGKLSVALTYRLHGRALKSENVVTLDQFTFGEKVDSPDAIKLPVKLGIAILKDRNGKIVLDVPIEGSLDNPEFRLKKVIFHELWVVVEKAMTSPFSVLGALFGGGKGEEISYQDFPPGTGELTPASKEKLDVLVKALYERPALQLEISGSVDRNADRDGLRVVNLEKQLRTQKWLALRKADRTTATADQISVAPEERADLIRKLYADALSKGQIVPSSGTNASGTPAPLPSLIRPTKSDRGATLLLKRETFPASASKTSSPTAEASTDPFELVLLNNIAVSDGDFLSLASDRAKAVREYVLQSGKVEPERLFLTEAPTSGVKSEGSRVYLQLQ